MMTDQEMGVVCGVERDGGAQMRVGAQGGVRVAGRRGGGGAALLLHHALYQRPHARLLEFSIQVTHFRLHLPTRL